MKNGLKLPPSTKVTLFYGISNFVCLEVFFRSRAALRYRELTVVLIMKFVKEKENLMVFGPKFERISDKACVKDSKEGNL